MAAAHLRQTSLEHQLEASFVAAVIESSNYPNIPLPLDGRSLHRWIRDGAVSCRSRLLPSPQRPIVSPWPPTDLQQPSTITDRHPSLPPLRPNGSVHPIIALHTQSADASRGCLEAGGHWWCGKPWAKHPQSPQKHSSSRRIFNIISRKVSLPP